MAGEPTTVRIVRNKNMKIAISGTIGSGKSVACEYLCQNKGYDVFDCDQVNRKLLEKDEAGYLKVKEVFPECFEDGELDKKKLSALVFNNQEEKKKLEDIMHPLILNELNKREDDPLFAEVPLLFEAGWDKYFDHNLLIVTDMDLLVARLEERGLEKEDILRRLNNQISVEEKIKRADKIIYNNGSLLDLYRMIDLWLEEIIC